MSDTDKRIGELEAERDDLQDRLGDARAAIEQSDNDLRQLLDIRDKSKAENERLRGVLTEWTSTPAYRRADINWRKGWEGRVRAALAAETPSELAETEAGAS